MGRKQRFTKPETIRLEISDGDWVEVKKELNVGDQKRLESAGTGTPLIREGRVYSPINWEIFEFERTLVYLVDWSLCDGDGKSVAVNIDTMRALDVESFNEIRDIIAKHTAEMYEAKKSLREAKEKEMKENSPESEPATT